MTSQIVERHVLQPFVNKWLQIGITKIREVAGTDKEGTNVYGVIKAAELLGFSAKGVKGNKEAFFSEFPLPCIAHMIVDGNLLHYVVIHKSQKSSDNSRSRSWNCKTDTRRIFREKSMRKEKHQSISGVVF